MSGRCVSCNKILKDTEMFWIEERKEHNDMCGPCRVKARSVVDPDDLNNSTLNLEISEIEESIEEYRIDKEEDHNREF